MKYIQNNLTHQPETYHDFFKLKSVLAKLLSLRLMKIFYEVEDGQGKAIERRDIYNRDLGKLGKWLLLENKSIHSMKQTFEKTGAELEKIGFLSRSPSIKPNKAKDGYNINFMGGKKIAEDRYWTKPRKKPLEKRREFRRDIISLASGDTEEIQNRKKSIINEGYS